MRSTIRGKYEKRADDWGPGTHRELLEFLDELACDADKDVEHWKRKARRLGEYAAKLNDRLKRADAAVSFEMERRMDAEQSLDFLDKERTWDP